MKTDVVDYGEQTLALVYNALENVGISGVLAQDAVTEMLNNGILFRERKDAS